MKKKFLSFSQMINLNMGFLGIQFGWGLQMANMSGIYKFLGASASQVGYLWVFAPLTGMLVQPVLGRFSDRTWVQWLGRRRPYILAGALASTLAIILMPHSSALWMAALLLFVLDSSVNIAMQPYRALVADVAPEAQHSKTYAVQTFLVGVGGCLAAALPWIFLHIFHLSQHTTAGEIPLSIRLSFYIGAAIFLIANIWTVLTSTEYPPSDLQKWKDEKNQKPLGNPFNFLWHIMIDFVRMPKIMREVSYVNFFSWAALFCMFMYFSLAIAQNIFGLPDEVNVAKSTIYGGLMEQGVALWGLCYALYTLIGLIYALFIPRLAKKLSRKGAHSFALFCGAISMIIAFFIHSEVSLLIDMIGIGFAWASIVTVPYAIFAGSLPEEKIGVYMGLFNITICTPEIIASLVLGFVALHVFHSHASYIILLGGICFVIAGFLSLLIHDKKIEEEVI